MGFQIRQIQMSQETTKKFKPLFDEIINSGIADDGEYDAGIICDVRIYDDVCVAAVIPKEDYQRVIDLMLEIVKKYKARACALK